MPFIPHTPDEVQEMLSVVGVRNLDDLFADIPPEMRPKHFDLPKGQSEFAVCRYFEDLAAANVSPSVSFLGAGFYAHYVPRAVDALSGRSEFYTSYTPYQAECSQGTLQAIFEYQTAVSRLLELGKDVLIVYDDLSKHAIAYRALSLLLERSPGREAYPGDVFYLHSRLLERSAHLSDEKGGGSMTALPIVETQAGDVSAYIPTNVISITDGQIFLETELFHAGVMPAVNPGISVSRVGGNAQIKAMKKVAGTLKLAYSQYRELQSFAQFGSDLDADTKRRLAQGERIVEVLKQDRNSPVPVEQQVCILYAVTNDYLVDVPVEQIAVYEQELYEDLSSLHDADVLAPIRESGALSEGTKAALDKALAEFTAAFLKSHA